jgi:hypothetical protein
MAEHDYLVTIIKLDASVLRDDGLAYADVPDAVSNAIAELAPRGSLAVTVLYLVDESQHRENIRPVLDYFSLPYPELIAASLGEESSSSATIVRLDAARKRRRTREQGS